MAKTTNTDYSLRRGKLNKKSPLVYRVRNGKQQSYVPNENAQPPSEAQKAYRKNFGKITAAVNAIMNDPQQVAEWEQKRKEFNKKSVESLSPIHYTTTRQFAHAMISQQIEKAEAKKRRKKPVSKALPKGVRLRVKHFSDLTTTELYEILKVRFSVFYMEQHIYYQDMDNIDYNAIHLAVFKRGQVIAYARLFPGTHIDEWIIGRMLTTERGKGYGQFILEQAVAEAEKQGAKSILIHAQTLAAPFYERFGFQTSGDIFMEADIPHVLMKK